MRIDHINVGEIRFGPSFYHVNIDGKAFKGKIFGYEIFENQDCDYIVLQEWLTTDYTTGPITRPLIIDKTDYKFAVLSEGKKGFSSNFLIKNKILYYDQVNLGSGQIRHFECDIAQLKFIQLDI